ncbi:putative amidoligase domain-containing protein [Evansella clarkii]|uniref:putative amidoligase domain-containing protein n=1 Tax=Evansella clarkii TaxID=79879 RepID=UPI000B43BE9C|nr:hypothetical protein [Evansella clarkii]
MKPWEQHYVKTIKKEPTAVQLTVTGEEFVPFTIEFSDAENKCHRIHRQKDVSKFYSGKDMLDLAMMAAYYSGTPHFTATVQRKGKDLGIVSVTEAKKRQETEPKDENAAESPLSLLGADLEIMLLNKTTGRFTAVPMQYDFQKEIGVDQALIRKNHHFYQPVIELRARPQPAGKALHEEFRRLKLIIKSKARAKKLEIICEENPVGRFMLGGHLHVSSQKPTYRRISLLDSLLTIPLASAQVSSSLSRRQTYGRLGACRVNKFNGFEYRSLPTWFHLIDNGLPFFQWSETLLFNETLPALPVSDETAKAYYTGDRQQLKRAAQESFEKISSYLTKNEAVRLEDWQHFLKKLTD